MAKFLIQETVGTTGKTVRLGAGTGSANHMSSSDVGKFVKLAGSSRYNLASAGDAIEGVIIAVQGATLDDYTIGSIKDKEYLAVTFDGLQATAGTGTIANGDYVVVGTVVAKGTALSAAAKVCKATVQPGDVPANLTAAAAQTLASLHAWRVVSLGSANSGAVGTVGVIERVGT